MIFSCSLAYLFVQNQHTPSADSIPCSVCLPLAFSSFASVRRARSLDSCCVGVVSVCLFSNDVNLNSGSWFLWFAKCAWNWRKTSQPQKKIQSNVFGIESVLFPYSFDIRKFFIPVQHGTQDQESRSDCPMQTIFGKRFPPTENKTYILERQRCICREWCAA